VTVYTDFPDEIEKPFIEVICAKLNCKRIWGSRFTRYGRSGARILLAFPGKSEPRGKPYLIKIGPSGGKHGIREEYQAMQKNENMIPDCDLYHPEHQPFNMTVDGEQLSALLLNFKGGASFQSARSPKTFRDVVYAKDNILSCKKVLHILEEVYDERLKEAHRAYKDGEQKVESLCREYFRKRKKAERNIRRVLGNLSNKEKIEFLGERIMNPLKMLQRIPNRICFAKGRVHGDLHPDNIVLDRYNTPCVVDWAWSLRKKDVLVDFVLMENSVRFMLFPRFINLDEQKQVDKNLLSEDGWNTVESLRFSNKETKRCYVRLSKMIGTIRNRAKQVLGNNFTMERYLLSQFIVLYGLLEFDTYEPQISTRALGMIAKELIEKHPALAKKN